jgi:hypothetical protein
VSVVLKERVEIAEHLLLPGRRGGVTQAEHRRVIA